MGQSIASQLTLVHDFYGGVQSSKSTSFTSQSSSSSHPSEFQYNGLDTALNAGGFPFDNVGQDGAYGKKRHHAMTSFVAIPLRNSDMQFQDDIARNVLGKFDRDYDAQETTPDDVEEEHAELVEKIKKENRQDHYSRESGDPAAGLADDFIQKLRNLAQLAPGEVMSQIDIGAKLEGFSRRLDDTLARTTQLKRHVEDAKTRDFIENLSLSESDIKELRY